LSVALLLFSAITLLARTFPLTNFFLLVLAVGSPIIPLVALLSWALAVVAHRNRLSFFASLIVVITLGLQVNWYYIGRTTAVTRHVELRVLSSNLRKGQADALSFVGLADREADVIAVSELTSDAVLRYSRAGIDEQFPYSVLIPATGSEGVGLWSRYPLITVQSKRDWNTFAAAKIQIPGVRYNPLVVSLHATSPLAHDVDSFGAWRRTIEATRARLENFAQVAGPVAVIVAGDFNSTPDMSQFRDLLTNGYRDAVDQTGSGFAPTFPSNTAFPPLLTIDHVLTRHAAASSVWTVDVPGSDHRGLIATIQVPVDPTAP
jgi:endonuclease/exonuclease/phosphatase (EEP) superfamily protein YafD